MNYIFIFSFLFLNSAQASITQEGGGFGTRGGGDVVGRNGKLVLRDVNDGSVCEWKTMNTFADFPAMKELMATIESKHPYLAFQLQEIISKLTVCMSTGTLKSVPSENSFMATIGRVRRQIAVREGNQIYIDMKIFRNLAASEKALLVIHEAAHLLVGDFLENRSAKIRSFVKMVSQIKKLSDDDIRLNLQSNDMLVGWVSIRQWPLIKSIIDPNILMPYRALSLSQIMKNSDEFTFDRDCFYFDGIDQREKNAYRTTLLSLLFHSKNFGEFSLIALRWVDRERIAQAFDFYQETCLVTRARKASIRP